MGPAASRAIAALSKHIMLSGFISNALNEYKNSSSHNFCSRCQLGRAWGRCGRVQRDAQLRCARSMNVGCAAALIPVAETCKNLKRVQEVHSTNKLGWEGACRLRGVGSCFRHAVLSMSCMHDVHSAGKDWRHRGCTWYTKACADGGAWCCGSAAGGERER